MSQTTHSTTRVEYNSDAVPCLQKLTVRVVWPCGILPRGLAVGWAPTGRMTTYRG